LDSGADVWGSAAMENSARNNRAMLVVLIAILYSSSWLDSSD